MVGQWTAGVAARCLNDLNVEAIVYSPATY